MFVNVLPNNNKPCTEYSRFTSNTQLPFLAATAVAAWIHAQSLDTQQTFSNDVIRRHKTFRKRCARLFFRIVCGRNSSNQLENKNKQKRKVKMKMKGFKYQPKLFRLLFIKKN